MRDVPDVAIKGAASAESGLKWLIFVTLLNSKGQTQTCRATVELRGGVCGAAILLEST